MNKRVFWLLDFVFVLALGAFVVAGVPFAPLHGDEAMQIYMSRDYTTALIEGRWGDLPTQPPYEIDSDAHLRLINGTINRYAIGAALDLGDFPMTLPRPGWDWGLSYADNVATAHRPSPDALNAARLPSALFTAASVGVMFLIGRQMGGRPAAYVAAAVYALNPALLLNGRRALQEGSMLCFGLATVLIALWLTRRSSRPLWAWALFTLMGALTLASKHSGVVFVAAALALLVVAALVRRAGFFKTVSGVIASGGLMLALFLALSPALWNDPPARAVNLLEERARLLDIQVAIDPIAPMTFVQRVEAILLQPAVNPVMYYELASWDVEPIRAEIAAYGAWYGYPGGIVGAAIMALAGVGLLMALRRWRDYAGLLVWFALTALSLLVNPLPWQRYYLPLIPVIAALTGVGANGLIARVRRGVRD